VAHAEILIVLLGVLVVLAGTGRRLDVPAPILLVAGGVAISVIPGLPNVDVGSDVIFLIFLPPLLYAAAFNSSPKELRTHVRAIGILAIGLVIATTAAVAVIVHTVVPGFTWPAAFVLGAILAPTDPVAAIAVVQRLNVSPRIAAVIEGESLVNDGVGLVAYRVAVGAATSGTFSALDAGGQFLLTSAGGVAVGLVVGWVIIRLRSRIDDAPVEIALSLFTPYFAYIGAEAAHVSGILAAVTVGLYLGVHGPGLFTPAARLEAIAFWRTLSFLLESTLFLLLGLQFADVAGRVRDLSPELVALTLAVTVVVVTGLRVVWMYTLGPLLRSLIPGPTDKAPRLSPRERLVVGWSGMRGAVSLAAAMALPVTAHGGTPFPQRDLIIFVTFSVIVIGLVLQGLTLPLLIRRLGIEGDGDGEAAEHRGREAAARAALARLDELGRGGVEDQVRAVYRSRLARSRAPLQDAGDDEREHAEDYAHLREQLLREERRAISEMHARGELPEDALRNIERDIDLDEARLAP
jgi:Na+/H+ antiporter